MNNEENSKPTPQEDDDNLEGFELDDDSDVEDIIEIDLDDLDDLEDKEKIDKKEEDFESTESTETNVSKHKVSGKHSLQFDTIFKGKRTVLSEDESTDNFTINNDVWMPDITTNFHYEVYQNDKYIREKDLKEKLYNVLKNSTDIDFDCNRRKPSKIDFNNYFFIVKTELQIDNFSNIEIFNELSYYFSDNLMNMFKLLDNKWRNLIIDELQEHIGKINSDKTILHKNIPIGSELEFNWMDQITLCDIVITGEVIGIREIEEDIYEYLVNSYQNEYTITIDKIKKILNNTKFKYNLNKLNNIDFL